MIVVRMSTLAVALLLSVSAAEGHSQVADSSFDSDGVRIRYQDQGAGTPVLLIHGFAVNTEMNWVAPGVVASLVRAGYRVITYDARGHGGSDKPHEPSRYGPVEVEDAIRLLNHLNVQRAHVVGYSRGGLVANRLRARYPSRVISITLGGFAEDPGGADPLGPAARAEIADSLERGSFGPLLRGLQPPGGAETPPEQLSALAQMMVAMNDMRALAAAFRADSAFGPATEAELRANRVPALAIIGELDVFRADLDRMAAAMSELEVLVILGADHVSALGRKELLTALLGFLAKHRSSASR